MRALLLDRPSAGATTCILVGRVDEAELPDLSAFQSVLWFVDAAGRRELPGSAGGRAVNVAVLEETDVAALHPLLEKFVLLNGRRLPRLCISDDVAARFQAGYEEIVAAIHGVMESAHRIRVTRQAEGFLWQKHLLLNLPEFLKRRVPREWAGALRGIPAFVCGAGPSLDVSASVLQKVSDRGVVFAADSALRTLARHGVHADFAVSVDAAKPPEKCLAADDEPSRVVLAGISPPAWREVEAEFRLFFLSGRHLTEDWLATFGVARTPVGVLENCGITALELARFLGCSPIHLLGMDLAADAANPGRKHAKDSDQTIDRGAGFPTLQAMPKVPGNYTEQVPTFLFGELCALNSRIAAWPPDLVINVNDRGARIGNTVLVHPRDFVLQQGGPKRQALSRLAAPECGDAGAAQRGLAEIGAQGAQGCRLIAGLRAALESGGPAKVVAILAPVFADERFARALGAFSLKVMPLLAPPVEGDAVFWNAILDELEELCCLAESAYGVIAV